MGVKTKTFREKSGGKINIKSMTGFGSSSEKSPYGKVTVDIKTLNHKSLSVTVNPPNGFFLLEEQVNEMFTGKVLRGKVFVRITTDSSGRQKSLHKVNINEQIAEEYMKKIKKAKKDLGVKGDINISELIHLPGVIENTSGEEVKIWPYIEKAMKEAIRKLITYRLREGKELARDCDRRLKTISESLKGIEKNEKLSIEEYRKKTTQAFKKAAKGVPVNKEKLEEEVSFFARNCDIAEEVTRLTGHLKAFKDSTRNVKTDVGKKLDFIAQEMQREANTIGAKSGDFRIAKAVIGIKSEIEKMREQVKNVE